MKLFRRISVLALVAVLVCLFSASAFAATSFSDLEMYDDGETYVDVYASINSTSSSGTLSLTAVGLQSNSIEITLTYTYLSRDDEVLRGYNSTNSANGETYCSISSLTHSNLKQMKSATYIFYAQFSSWSGEHTYNSGAQAITYS